MGELILCNQVMAALPYYMENASLNVYSLEEVCYYIEKNLYLIDVEFMSEELCTWIEKQLGMKQLAEELRNIIYQDGKLVDFVSRLLMECRYCDRDMTKHILQVLQEMQNMSVYECGKMRADRFMTNHRYVNAVLEYRRLLQNEEEAKKNPVLTGAIWHNLGVAYARLFLFDMATKYFLKAYGYHQKHESLMEALASCKCGKNIDELEKIQRAYGISDEERDEAAQSWRELSRSEEIVAFEQKIDEIFDEMDGAIEENPEMVQIIEEMKQEYRKNERI